MKSAVPRTYRDCRNQVGEARRCDDIAGAPDARAAALAVDDQHRLTEARGDRRGGVADMDHKRATADRGAVDPFRGLVQIMRDRHQRLASSRDRQRSRKIGRSQDAADRICGSPNCVAGVRFSA
jgi:hypothetical protein